MILIFLDAIDANCYSPGKAGTRPFVNIPKYLWSHMDLTSLGPRAPFRGLFSFSGVGDTCTDSSSCPNPAPSLKELGLPAESSTPKFGLSDRGSGSWWSGPVGKAGFWSQSAWVPRLTATGLGTPGLSEPQFLYLEKQGLTGLRSFLVTLSGSQALHQYQSIMMMMMATELTQT